MWDERRTPHGVRGLKSGFSFPTKNSRLSHPAWGAWIEILCRLLFGLLFLRRTPHGVRGLKLLVTAYGLERCWVAPRMGCVD